MRGLLRRLLLGSATPPRKSAEQRVAELQVRLREVRARYDAAQTTTENAKHWAAADGLSAIGTNSRDVRRTLRNRARHEVANNGYAWGVGHTLCNDTIGTGPRLQVRTGIPGADAKIEALWLDWTRAIDLEGKLWTARLSKFEDGEAFALLQTNDALRTEVKLDIRLVEADQVSTPVFHIESPNAVDGILFDSKGNPLTYHILKSHPGDPYYAGASYDYDEVPARNVLHYFRALRPEQKRGVPEITSSLPLFAQLRRYTLAVVAAAEVVADFALVIESNGTASAVPAVAAEAFDTIELEKRMATVLPEGFKLGQAKPEQPTTTYADFKRQLITEIARPLNMPFNIAAGDSSSYNYSSGRLDHQTYFKALEVERALIRRTILEPLFRVWFLEAVRISGLLPQELRSTKLRIQLEWLWDGHEHVDPAKEANAQETRLRNFTTSLTAEYAKQGTDVETAIETIARERKLLKKHGLTMADMQQPARVATPEDDDDE